MTFLVLTVGTTSEPLVKAVDELHAELNSADAPQGRPDRHRLEVLLIYGRPFPGQSPSPFDVAQEVKARADKIGVPVRPCEVADPEDLDTCLQAVRSILRQIQDADRIVVNFTGGTKALSAAAVHAALTESPVVEVVFDYVGGQVRDAAGRVVRQAMRVRRSARTAVDELLGHVLDLAERCAYREALALAQRLPDSGRCGFVRRAVDALCKWDEFDYEGAVTLLGPLCGQARGMTDVPRVGQLAATVMALIEPGDRLKRLVRDLSRVQEGALSHPGAPLSDMGLLTADALENAERRLREGRHTDSVLRAYRAVETAVQARLLAHDINPWRPNWGAMDPSVVDAFLELQRGRPSWPPQSGAQPLPRVGAPETPTPRAALPADLGLGAGLALVRVMERDMPEDLLRRLGDLQTCRNQSHLEHGYRRITADDARRLVGYGAELASHILGHDIAPLRRQVSHARKGG
jgi:CRISPR-associated protein (TIGR02710 family)